MDSTAHSHDPLHNEQPLDTIPPGDVPTLLKSLEWRSIGPYSGGRVVAVTGDVSHSQVFYFGSTGGGVWKTTNGGVFWENVSDGFFTTAAVGCLAVSDSNPNVVYAGTGEACIRSNVSHGDGVYRSDDGGRSWRNLGLAATRHISRVVVHPTNPDLVYVAALGHAWGPNPERPGLAEMGTDNDPVPVTGLAANFSSMPRIAPPP